MKRAGKPATSLIVVLACAMALSPTPARSAQPNVGGGSFAGDIRFAGSGIPPTNTPCRSASFTISAVAAVAVVNGSGSQGAWVKHPLVNTLLTGSGTSTCENALVGGGLLTLDPISVVNPATQAQLACTSITGGYTRTGTDFAAVLSGNCRIDAADAGTVTVYVRAQVGPTAGTGNGVTTAITAAAVGGSFVIVPA